jgi:Domain of unknown function (DUF1707)
MSFGAGEGSGPVGPGGMLASEEDREACQAELKQAYEDQRLTLDEFEARVGRAVAARTQGELAQLTRDLPQPVQGELEAPPGRSRLVWLIPVGVVAVVLVALAVGLFAAFSSGTAHQASIKPAAPANPAQNTVPRSSGPARCPVGTSPAELAIANALATDPVYADPSSTQLTAAQARRVQAEIGRDDPGRIRIAVLTPTTVRADGGERALANAIASCQNTSAGVTMVSTPTNTYLVTSYTDNQPTVRAVGAALNTHASMASGLMDAVRRMTIIDKGSS